MILTCSTAPAHPYATDAVVYTALFHSLFLPITEILNLYTNHDYPLNFRPFPFPTHHRATVFAAKITSGNIVNWKTHAQTRIRAETAAHAMSPSTNLWPTSSALVPSVSSRLAFPISAPVTVPAWSSLSIGVQVLHAPITMLTLL